MSKMPIAASSPAPRTWLQAVVGAGRDQVRPDQAVGGRAADEERARQQPEVAHARRARAATSTALRNGFTGRPRRLRLVGAVGQQPDVGGVGRGGTRARAAPRPGAPPARSPPPRRASRRRSRARRAAAGRSAGRWRCWRVSMPMTRPRRVLEPAVGDDRGQRDRDRAGRAADHHAPQQVELPRRVISVRQARRRSRRSSARSLSHGACRTAPRSRPRTARPAPYSSRLTETAPPTSARRPAELVLERHRSTPGVARNPAAISSTTNVTASHHPRVVHPAPEDAGDHDRRILGNEEMVDRHLCDVLDGSQP